MVGAVMWPGEAMAAGAERPEGDSGSTEETTVATRFKHSPSLVLQCKERGLLFNFEMHSSN